MISLFGTWMQATAQGFLIYELTKSPGYLGIVGFANGIPAWIFMLYAGVVADRMSRRRLMIITQSCMMVQAFILAALTFLHVVQPWHIVLLSFGLGTANAFDAPARLSLVTELVDREHLTNAIAMNATMFNVATAVGPGAAGIAYAALGPAWCFTLNGISFIGVIIALASMEMAPFVRRISKESPMKELGEGIRYAVNHPIIRALLFLTASTTLLGTSLMTLFPAWAVDILHGDASTNGWLQSLRGIGALIAALTIASLGHLNFRGKILTVGTIAYPVFMMLFSVVRTTPLALLILVFIGGSFIFVFNLTNATIQTNVDDKLRGRVMAVYSLVFFGFMPVGALMVGGVAQTIGPPLTVFLCGAGALLFAGGLWKFSPKLREQP